MVDPNLELDGAGEGAEDLELELETTLPKEGEKKEPAADPLDDIQDPEARAEAKKHRAIGRREDKDQKQEAKPSQEFLTRTDFHKANERRAILSATADAEVKANWAEIIPFYTPRRGKETTEDILEDIKDAITLYKVRNPVTEKDDSADVLTVHAVAKSGGGGETKATPKPKDPPNFKLPKQPKDWYPPKKDS